MYWFGSRLLILLWLTALLAGAATLPTCLHAQQSSPAQTPSSTKSPSPSEPATAEDDELTTMFPHSESSRYWLSGQANIILQWHPSFHSPYGGPNSLSPAAQSATSRVFTLYTGLELTSTTELLADVESSSGGGIGAAVGLAGFTNLDVVRTAQGTPIPVGPPYLARLMIHQIVPLGRARAAAARGPLGLWTSLPARRLEFRLGKASLADFFDVNSVGSDSHLQFLNWTVVNNGAYDYAADTRGYTWLAMVEFDAGRWSLRFAEALMPKVANGIHLDADLARARSENVEAELRGHFLPHRAGVVRALSYVNHADMGSYHEAIEAFLAGRDKVPDVTQHRRQGRIKYGFTANFEQALTGNLTAYGRFGWNEGHNESFAYTEVDQHVSFGAALAGPAWHRRYDRLGGAFALNAISGDHRRYLALGGSGFLLGDGNLNYGRERIFEGYYTAHIWRGTFVSIDLQHLDNPGYNRDRGPVLVPAARLHIDF
jgi:high affinity Mn2+ porin